MSMNPAVPPTTAKPPAGWYTDPNNPQMVRYWNGEFWTNDWAPAQNTVHAPAQNSHGPMTHSALNVRREVIYNREQKGHSLLLHLCFGWMLLYIPTIYYAASPNHYFHT